jgi:WD40 repeat protein
VSSIAFSADGRRIVSDSFDHTIRILNVECSTEELCIDLVDGKVSSVAYSPDGRRVAAGLVDGTVLIWDATSGDECLRLESHHSEVREVVFSPDGEHVVSMGNETCIWNSQSGDCLEVIQGMLDVRAIAAGKDRFRWRISNDELGMLFELTATGATAGWFPQFGGWVITVSPGRTCAGAGDNHLYVIRLEGDE